MAGGGGRQATHLLIRTRDEMLPAPAEIPSDAQGIQSEHAGDSPAIRSRNEITQPQEERGQSSGEDGDVQSPVRGSDTHQLPIRSWGRMKPESRHHVLRPRRPQEEHQAGCSLCLQSGS
ncbi:hypothetical protein NDU88_001543 [Pleurodeles waltl]|uniref:Uncharacterized protein n=1 Tax=Pleurodeles waltl TaxID=8319 RepID=A0AAV7WL71_PLEWA|nr:hypothetical protein NDU88_001543 [Pleurodeles waltl]